VQAAHTQQQYLHRWSFAQRLECLPGVTIPQMRQISPVEQGEAPQQNQNKPKRK